MYAAPDPRIYLQHDWYVVEVVVFERTEAPPSPEQLVHGSEYRFFAADLQSLSPSEQQQRKLEEIVQAHSGSSSLLAPRGSTESQIGSPVRSGPAEADEPTIPNKGCWLHQWTLTAENLDVPTKDSSEIALAQLVSPNEQDVLESQSVLNGTLAPATRDPLLPDWLPDEWETDELILHRVARILGLCQEDMSAMLESQVLGSMEQDAEKEESPVTAGIIEREYATYERDLHRSAGTRRDRESLSLTRAANRLSNEGFRIIDHAAWHQDALEREASKPVLVQFGESQPDNRFEIEGTVVLSSARFLHLDIDLWKSYSPKESSTAINRLPRLLYYAMQESRRLTLGKTHYFDHPKFGLLVRVQRLPVPDRLVALLEQLDNAF